MSRSLAFSRTGGGAPIVLLHGLGSRRQIWTPVMAALAEQGELFAVDLRGFGGSPLDGRSAAFDAQVDAVAEFCEQQGIERAHLVGNSMGGAIAIELARRGLARSVTAFSPIGFWRRPGRIWCQRALGGARRLCMVLRPAAPVLLRARVVRASLVLVFGRPTKVDANDALEEVRALVAATGFREAAASFAGYRFADPDGLAGIPMTVAWGSRDILLAYRPQHRRARERLPQATHVTLRGCGHTPFYDDPAQCARVVRDTIERVAATY
jgi:pimeloyl-ACP methyl ester carboxylesterase